MEPGGCVAGNFISPYIHARPPMDNSRQINNPNPGLANSLNFIEPKPVSIEPVKILTRNKRAPSATIPKPPNAICFACPSKGLNLLPVNTAATAPNMPTNESIPQLRNPFCDSPNAFGAIQGRSNEIKQTPAITNAIILCGCKLTCCINYSWFKLYRLWILLLGWQGLRHSPG